jgi:hypothetical protein
MLWNLVQYLVDYWLTPEENQLYCTVGYWRVPDVCAPRVFHALHVGSIWQRVKYFEWHFGVACGWQPFFTAVQLAYRYALSNFDVQPACARATTRLA